MTNENATTYQAIGYVFGEQCGYVNQWGKFIDLSDRSDWGDIHSFESKEDAENMKKKYLNETNDNLHSSFEIIIW